MLAPLLDPLSFTKAFKTIDVDNSGMVTLKEFRAAVETLPANPEYGKNTVRKTLQVDNRSWGSPLGAPWNMVRQEGDK